MLLPCQLCEKLLKIIESDAKKNDLKIEMLNFKIQQLLHILNGNDIATFNQDKMNYDYKFIEFQNKQELNNDENICDTCKKVTLFKPPKCWCYRAWGNLCICSSTPLCKECYELKIS